jgi:hypothetical protein
MARLAESGGSGKKLSAAEIAAQVAATRTGLQPTVTIGGAPAGYRPATTMQPTVTIGGAPAGYAPTPTPNYITGQGVPGVSTQTGTVTPNYITGQNVPGATPPPAPATGKTITNRRVNPDGSVTLFYSDGSSETVGGPVKAPKEVSAFDAASDAILARTLTSYGLEGMAATIAKIRSEYPEISSEQLLTLLKNDTRYNAEYNKRFAGNVKLKEAGLPTLDDATYLKAEDEYKKVFTAYGATSLANRDYYATLIGNRMDAVDVTDRMNLAYARLQALPEVKKAFQTFYSAVSDGDILAAILDPKTQLPVLQKKVAAAEIGGAALAQNLKTSLATATELQGLGVTQAQAQAGYTTIAQALPTYEKFLEMRTGQDVETADAQALLEESKLKKKARAIQQEQSLIGEEIGRFSGGAGRLASRSRAQGLI